MVATDFAVNGSIAGHVGALCIDSTIGNPNPSTIDGRSLRGMVHNSTAVRIVQIVKRKQVRLSRDDA